MLHQCFRSLLDIFEAWPRAIATDYNYYHYYPNY
jgi:hypothetical protein